jgi:hypothetical protein
MFGRAECLVLLLLRDSPRRVKANDIGGIRKGLDWTEHDTTI